MHDDCTTCEWLAREAERTATDLNRDAWISETDIGGNIHRAHYTRKDTP